ncbi:Vps5-domain-containing protein [Nadsonia fulvescens var. elongata DSM 6958]|uniref:Vps5-domain-containing protein n=1 Tax=Nadsonia fulvescens var. elongata DSM 6958 TaxID=857566 RepID=A0A1E3PM18_9ASCO|nr:Vps5-domain-containing protein [Nadsonia fulvescens var. elongata DSM 6958]
MVIIVGDPIKIGDITSAHTVYSIHTKSSTVDATVTRRYRDFRWLYHALQLGNPGIIVPPPPEKQAVGRFNEGFIEQRRLSLENMIKKISQHPILVEDEDFLIFLKSENFNNDVKHKHPNIDLNESIYVDSNSDTNNLLLNTKPNTGFMASLNFSFTPKFIEADEWFYEKKHYIDGLEVNLKGLLKALEIIVQQRKELSESIAEFSYVISKLSLVEISKPLTDVLDSFAQSQLNIKEIYQRQCAQDILTFGNSLEEFIRIIISVKAVFSQRINIDANLQKAEHEMEKKKKKLDKLMKQGRSYQVKIDAVSEEIKLQENKILNIKVMFDNITRTIKAEFKRFEKIRISDFRNTCEIFLENSIEAQKEAIEIWETFYQFAGF